MFPQVIALIAVWTGARRAGDITGKWPETGNYLTVYDSRHVTVTIFPAIPSETTGTLRDGNPLPHARAVDLSSEP